MKASGGIVCSGVIDGDNGYSTVVVQLFKRSATALGNNDRPNGTLIYNFSSGILSNSRGETSGTGFNGWSQTAPSATFGTKLYVTMATARSLDATDEILSNEWSTPSEYVADGMSCAPIIIYKRAASQPTDKPADGCVYTFATGVLSGTLNGWSTQIPAHDGNPCWVRHATAASSSTTDTINASEWSDPAVKLAEDGKNAIRLAIDNEHEDFLYDGSTLVAPSGGATAPLHLYDGPTDKTSSVSEWRINDTNNDAEANWKTSVNTNADASINTSTGVLTISGLKSASAKIRVRAKYNNKPYYAEFTGNKTNQDKYDIVLTPNSIAYNSANYQTQRIQVSASGIGIGGTKLSPSISWNQNSGNLRVFWSTVSIDNNGSTVIGTPTRLTSSYKDVTGEMCSANVGIYFELRWYNNSSAQDSSTDYRVCDYETVEIAKVTNGNQGDPGTGLKKVNTYVREYTLATWKSYMRDGESWSLAKSVSSTEYYDNSHIRVGDTCYIVGKVSDLLDKNGNKADITVYGVCTSINSTTIVMNMTQYVTSGPQGPKGDDGDDGNDGKDAVMYSLDPSPNNVNFRSNAVGDFLGTKTVTCKIKKTIGNTTTEISNGTDNLYLYFWRVGEPTSPAAYQDSGVTVTASGAIDANYPITGVRFTLSTSSTAGGINASNTVKEVTVPVLCDGRRGVQGPQGPQGPEGPQGPKGNDGTNGTNGTNGAAGKMFFSMGIYTYGKTYMRSTEFVPMVYYDNGVWNDALGTTGNYFYLAEGQIGTNVTPGTNDSIWVPAGSYGLVIAQGIFAEFAKLGSFIISGDFFISQCGTIIAGGSSQAVNEGSASIKRYYYNGVKSGYGFPSYMYFDANDPMAENVEGNTNTYTINGNGEMDCTKVKRIYFYASQATRLKITVTPSSESGYDFGAVGLLDQKTLSDAEVNAGTIRDDETPTLVKASGTASDYTTINISQGAHFLEIGYFKDSSQDSNQDKATFKFEEQSNNYIGGYSEMKFRPAKVINARTGAEYMAGGNVRIDKNGNVDITGTIRATNFYHRVCYYYGGGVCINGGGEYQKYSEGDGNLWYDTSGDADIIEILPVYGRNWGANWDGSKNNYTILLPSPSKCEGKVVTVYCRVFVASGPIAVGCVETNKMCNTWQKNSSTGKLEPASSYGYGYLTDHVTLNKAYAVQRYKLSEDWGGTYTEDGYQNVCSEYVFIAQNGYWFKIKG